MQNQIWHCDRCAKPCEYEDPENVGVLLSYDEKEAQIGKICNMQAYEKVCDSCGNDFYKIAEKCTKDCVNCPVTQVWGLSVLECLNFQHTHKLLDIEKINTEMPNNTIFAEVFSQFRIKVAIEKLKGEVWSNGANFDMLEIKAKELEDFS